MSADDAAPDPRMINLIMELRSQGITDLRVLSAMERVPRERFVPPSFSEQAYDNIALPIEQGQTISQPYIVAFMCQALEVGPRMKVLEIGAGSGYHAAVLAQLCLRVYTIERYRSLLKDAQARFTDLGIGNITTRLGDGAKGWPEQASFPRIIVTAAVKTPPPALIDQLAEDGILLLPLQSRSGEQDIVRIRRGPSGITEERLLPVRFVPLVEGIAKTA
jgi:protein-L-isoaspartate(D-aspartate) O-methyltransferase